MTLSEKYLVSVCSEYNHVRSWAVTRFRGMISTQPGSTPEASFKIVSLEAVEPCVSYNAGNDFGTYNTTCLYELYYYFIHSAHFFQFRIVFKQYLFILIFILVSNIIYIFCQDAICFNLFYTQIMFTGPFGEQDDEQVFVQKIVPETDQLFVRLASNGKRVCVIQSVDGSIISSFYVHECEGSSRMGSRPRRFIFTGHSNGTIQMWDLTTALDPSFNTTEGIFLSYVTFTCK